MPFPRQEDVRSGPTADADVVAPPAGRLSLDVVARPPPPDQLQFAQQSRELARQRFPDDDARLLHDAAGLGVAALRTEVRQQPGAQALGLADVDQLAALVEHAVDAGPTRTAQADALAELPHAFAAHLPRRRLAGRVEPARTEARERQPGEQPVHAESLPVGWARYATFADPDGVRSARGGILITELLTTRRAGVSISLDISGMSAPEPSSWDLGTAPACFFYGHKPDASAREANTRRKRVGLPR
jgi:hypothetical protein